MKTISGVLETSKQKRSALWIGYAACAWSLLFAIAHFYWGIEAATTGILTVPTGNIPLESGPAVGSGVIFAWVVTVGILCVLGGLIMLFCLQGDKMSRSMQLGATGVGIITMTAYVAYSFTVNGFVWIIAPGVLCMFGAAISLALVQPWGRFIPRWLLLLLAWIGGVIMIIHELYGGILQGLAITGMMSWQQEHLLIGAPVTQAALTMQQFITQNLIWGTWFLLGGVLFCVLAWLARSSLDER
ncbi:hypothetical protein [Ktedonospora formicarum]|uniref:Uncharacterized protein n=1 Tax=Ktedonospora formicarum TaxID=2778364 RepID=A0A8J3I3Q9_9CHLR|nr:hypothetical protein [Ktedonospora formicarum]GHO47011.1 hypothetical protein KSX_51740 [Ktedonospora formicarum]